MRRLALCVVLVLAMGVGSASAATWAPPVNIDPIGAPGSDIDNNEDPHVSAITSKADARGDIVVAWTQDDRAMAVGTRHVDLAYKPAGQAWLPLEEVGPPNTFLQSLAIDGHGDVSVAYGSVDETFTSQASVVTRAADGSCGPVREFGVPAAAPNAPFAWLATDDAGDLLVLYFDQQSSGGKTSTVFRPAGGAWQAPVALEPDAPVLGLVVLGFGMAPDGEATVLERLETPTRDEEVQARSFSGVSGWGAAVQVFTPPPGDPPQGAFAVSAPGEADYAFIEPDGRLVATSNLAGAATWTPLATVGTLEARTGCRPLRLVVDAQGEAVAACGELAGIEGQAYSQAWAAVRAPGGAWGPLEELASDRSDEGTSVQLVLTGEGRALLARLDRRHGGRVEHRPAARAAAGRRLGADDAAVRRPAGPDLLLARRGPRADDGRRQADREAR